MKNKRPYKQNRHKNAPAKGASPSRKPEVRPRRDAGRDTGADRESSSGPRPALYGFHAVAEAWLNPARRITGFYIADNAVSGFEDIMQRGRTAKLKRPAPLLTDKRDLEKMLPVGAVHQGLALTIEPLEEIGVQDLIIRAGDHCTLLMLDQVTDPHNVGAILRSASAFNCGGVIMQRRHAPSLDGVLAKTACGAIEHIPVAYETNLSRTLEELKEAGFFIYGLDERGEQSVRAIKPGGKSVLVLGAEGEGMRRLVREHCDALLRLPTSGAIQSLNVSNAAAVALYAFSAS